MKQHNRLNFIDKYKKEMSTPNKILERKLSFTKADFQIDDYHL